MILFLFTFLTSAFAGDGLGAATALTGGRFAAIAAELELSEAQRKTVSDAIYASNTAKIEIDAKVEKSRLEVRHLLGATTIDEKAVLKAVDNLSAAEAELRRNRVALVLTVRKNLSPEQWAELSEIRQERRAERREDRREGREEEDDD
jgi:Spy/CpxP family protein refolding chaperone